jgi:predicted neutral ceramidase superfamily lipid hydrolase
MVSKLLPVSFFAIPILTTFGYLLFDRKPSLQPLFIVSFCTIVFFIITVAGGNLVPSSPARYRTELGIAVSFFAAFLFVYLIEFLKFRVIEAKLAGKFWTVLANLVSPTMGAIFLITGIFIRDPMIYDSEDVLGIWTEVQKGSVWVARDNFMGYHAYIGYSITALAIGVLIYLAVKGNSVAKVKTIV